MDARNFVESIREHTEWMVDYVACMDAATFEGCINPAKKEDILARELAARKGAIGGARAAEAVSPGILLQAIGKKTGPSWDKNSLKSSWDQVTETRTAICTTFAKAIAYCMHCIWRPGMPNIELVAYRNHVFCIVNRSGANDVDPPPITMGKIPRQFGSKRKLPKPAEWRCHIGYYAIVDVWAGAMGWDSIYYGNRGTIMARDAAGNWGDYYPWPQMLNPLEQVMLCDRSTYQG